RELELARAIAGAGIADRNPLPPVPYDHGPRAVVALRDHALEPGIVERMVLDMDRHAPHAGIETGALGHGPALERPIELEAEVVVQAPRRVLLDHERERLSGRRDHAARLGRGLEVAFAAVLRERRAHGIRRARPGRPSNAQISICVPSSTTR